MALLGLVMVSVPCVASACFVQNDKCAMIPIV